MTEEIKKVDKKLNATEKEIEEVKKKQLDTEDPYKPTGKSKKARHRLNAVDQEIEEIKKQLDNARTILRDIIVTVSSEQKKRSMVAIAPERIEFDFNSLKFYIDFTLVASEHDGQDTIKGSIIYGTNRTLCFIFSNNQDNCKECQRTVRCDGLEDKPLISFEINQHGMIQSSGKLEGEWWINEIPDLDELHYRTLDLIWKEALDWANEIIVP